MNRIEEFRKNKKWTAKHLAELVGTSAPQIFRLEKGERKLSQDWMERIAKVLECTPADLISSDSSPLPEGPIPLISGFKSLPVLGNVQAGHWLDQDEQQTPTSELQHIDVPLVAPYDADKHYLLKVIGDSMNKVIPNGYYVVCVSTNGDCSIKPSVGDVVVVERTRFNGQMREVTIKRFAHIGARDVLVPESHDPKFKPVYPDEDKEAGTEVKIVAKVVNAVAGGF